MNENGTVHAEWQPSDLSLDGKCGPTGIDLPIQTTAQDAIAAYEKTAAQNLLQALNDGGFNPNGDWVLDPKYG